MAQEEKREAARILYLEGYTLTRINQILKISMTSLGKWQKQGQWAERRVRQNMLQENSVNDLFEIFEFQVRCLKKKKNEMEEAQDFTPFKPGEFDALQKLYSTIKSDHRQFSDYVGVLKELLQYVKDRDLDLAQKLTSLADEFLHEKHSVI